MQVPEDNFSVEDLVCNESFQQYCLGTSLEMQLSWKEWIAAHPERQEDIDYAKELVSLLSLKQGSRIEQLKQLRSGIKQREVLQRTLAFDPVVIPDLPILSKRKHSLYKYMAGAAAAAVLLVCVYFMSKQNAVPGYEGQQQVMRIVNSGKAPRKTVVLIDGTVITLAKESTIKLAKQFNDGQRELWLVGEAFFDVKHDTSKPFIVHTSFDEIRVLGTTFNVKAYPGSLSMETSLIRGSVQVNSKQFDGYSVILRPNEKLISSRVTGPIAETTAKAHFKISTINDVDANHPPVELKWVRTRLDIDNQPLSAISAKLESWYGIEIVINDEAVKAYRYSGIFENETIVKTLEALQLSYPFTFKIEQDKIIISK